jgi:hypothetical protein
VRIACQHFPGAVAGLDVGSDSLFLGELERFLHDWISGRIE